MVPFVIGDLTVAVGRLFGGAFVATLSAGCAAVLLYSFVVPLANTARETARIVRFAKRASRARREARALRRAYDRRLG